VRLQIFDKDKAERIFKDTLPTPGHLLRPNVSARHLCDLDPLAWVCIFGDPERAFTKVR